MLRSPFLWKLYGGTAVLIVVTAGAIVILAGRSIERTARDLTEQALAVQAANLRELALPDLRRGSDPEGALSARLTRLSTTMPGLRLSVLDGAGHVVADSVNATGDRTGDRTGDHTGDRTGDRTGGPATGVLPRMDPHAHPELLDARLGGNGTIHEGVEGEQAVLVLALPVREDAQLLGYARVSLPRHRLSQELEVVQRLVLWGACLAAGVALVAGFLVARRAAVPLAAVAEVAEAIASGDYRRRVRGGPRDELGQVGRAFNVVAEQLRERVQTIAQDRNKLLAILSSMVEGVLAVDAQERVTHMNSVAGKILGTHPVRALGMRCYEVTRNTEIVQTLTRALQQGAEARAEVVLVGSPGDQTIEVLAAPLRDPAGAVEGAVLVLHDITELRHLERVRQDFVANVSHELKTPITAIRGFAETLMDDPQMPAETRERFIGRIREQSFRLSALVGDLLTLARLDAEGDTRITDELVDLGRICRQAARAQAPVAEQRSVRVTLEISDGVWVAGDASGLDQIASNLLSNAVQYTPSGGRVWLRVFARDESAILEAQDTGVGIEPRHRERIFERFYRIDKARSRELGGTGLGLAIVKHLVHLHRGTIQVESTPGHGSVFRVTLPLAAR